MEYRVDFGEVEDGIFRYCLEWDYVFVGMDRVWCINLRIRLLDYNFLFGYLRVW